MLTQTVDPNYFQQKAKQIRDRVPTILSGRGLSPKFNRWRLTHDADSGMVVLFAVLNTKYIASHTATAFRDYFDPCLLHDLEDDLDTQVVSCNSDGLRYAFILNPGQIEMMPTHVDIPFLDGDRLLARAACGDKPVANVMAAAPLIAAILLMIKH